jgi:serine/alanine adding enzyme
MLNECVLDRSSPREWDEFIQNHPKSNIFQTRSLYDVYSKTDNYQPIAISLTDTGKGEVAGILSGVIISEMGGMARRFSSHAVVQGGPLVADEQKTNVAELVKEFDRMVRKKAIYSEIRNIHESSYLNGRLDSYSFDEHLDFHISLEQPLSALWSGLSKSRRKNINKAEELGISVVEVSGPGQLVPFCELIDETYHEVGIPPPPHSLFHSAFDQLVPKGQAKFFLAYDSDDCIGARAVLTYNGMIYDWYAGSSRTALSSNPNDLLVWHILKWGVERGYSYFDFGGAGNPNEPYGPREFKRRFGGKLVSYGRYSRTYSPVDMWCARTGLKLYRKLADPAKKRTKTGSVGEI